MFQKRFGHITMKCDITMKTRNYIINLMSKNKYLCKISLKIDVHSQKAAWKSCKK